MLVSHGEKCGWESGIRGADVVEKWAIDLIGVDDDGLLAGNIDQLFEGLARDDSSSWVLWVAMTRMMVRKKMRALRRSEKS